MYQLILFCSCIQLTALKEQLQRVLQEKRALEEECRKRRKGRESDKGRVRGTGKVQSRSQHTQTASTERKHKKSPPHPVTTHSTPLTTHTTSTHRTPSQSRATTATQPIVTTTTKPVNNETATNSTAAHLKTTVSDVAVDTSVTMETAAMDTTSLPSTTVEHTATGNVAMTTTAEVKTGVLEMMEDIINKVIIDQSDLISADTNTLHRIHGDLQQLCDVILSCLAQSSPPGERGSGGKDGTTTTTESLASCPYGYPEQPAPMATGVV